MPVYIFPTGKRTDKELERNRSSSHETYLNLLSWPSLLGVSKENTMLLCQFPSNEFLGVFPMLFSLNASILENRKQVSSSNNNKFLPSPCFSQEKVHALLQCFYTYLDIIQKDFTERMQKRIKNKPKISVSGC